MAFALVGCGTELGDQLGKDFSELRASLPSLDLTSASYLNEEDACYAERKEMANAGSFFDHEQVQQAVVGGLIAAVVTGIVTQDTGSAVAAGAVGLGLGLANAYLTNLQRDGKSATAIAGQASNDIRNENRRIKQLIAAFNKVDRCRRDEARAVQRAYNAKSINRAEAEEQMAAVRDRRKEDVRKFEAIAKQIDSNSKNYAAVYNDIAADNGRGGLTVQEPGKRAKKTSKATKQAGTAEGSLKGASSSSMNRLERDCLTNVRTRDDCFDRVASAKEDDIDIDLDA